MLRFVLLAALAVAAAAQSIHEIRPGDNPQAVHDQAAPGDKLVFLPGLHEHPLRRHNALLYVDKPLDIELLAGAVLKLADGQTQIEPEPEVTIDHGAPKRLDDFQIGGAYDLSEGPILVTLRIDGEGADGRPDTFAWDVNEVHDLSNQGVAISGEWQDLAHGVQVKFDARTGHNAGSLWIVSYDGPESYGIRVGHGTQPDYIDNVRIYGRGEIDLNHSNNVQPSQFVKNISACVLLHGRVRDVSVEQITMRSAMRSVMVYGEHTGKLLRGGGTEGGESFDAENISIVGTRTINPVDKGYLLGHPSHRGRIHKLRCNYNYMETATTALEPNFNLDQYEVIGNVIKSGGEAIHCWRRSTNGLIKNNVRIDDSSGKPVVKVNSPGAWQDPENLIIRDNRNHLSDALGFYSSVTAGLGNRATGAYASVTGGRDNHAEADYSRAHGWGAKAVRPGEDALASGYFQTPGDAQGSRLVLRGTTAGAQTVSLGDGVAIPANSSVVYRITIVGRDASGAARAAFEAEGLAHRTASGVVELLGAEVEPIERNDPALAVEIAGGDGLDLRVAGLSGKTMRWVAQVELTQVIH